MRLVWSQASPPRQRRNLLPLAVVCIFLGGAVSGRPEIAEAPRPVRAAVASLLVTGGLLLLVSGAAVFLRKEKRERPSLSLAEPSAAPPEPEAPESVSSLQEEEQL